jgi:hypothetical protein
MENEKKFYCECCNYTALYKSEFDKHLKSAKHKRGGKYIDYKCNGCDYQGLNRWNLTMHQATTHYTIEQKKKLKYYCEYCDCICFSALYYNTHLKSPLHKSKMIIHNSEIGIPLDINLIEQNNNTKKISNSTMEENLKKYMKSLIDNLEIKLLNAIKNK